MAFFLLPCRGIERSMEAEKRVFEGAYLRKHLLPSGFGIDVSGEVPPPSGHTVAGYLIVTPRRVYLPLGLSM